jgi:hypothetical protein
LFQWLVPTYKLKPATHAPITPDSFAGYIYIIALAAIISVIAIVIIVRNRNKITRPESDKKE